MKGGKNSAKLDFNPSLSAKHNEKSRQVYLNAIFYLCFATPRRRRGGMCKGAQLLRKSRRVRALERNTRAVLNAV